MEKQNRFTEEEIERMRRYEKRTGEKVIYSFPERIELYREYNSQTLEDAVSGIQRAILARINPENEFDNPDDDWKLKTLEENLSAVKKILEERAPVEGDKPLQLEGGMEKWTEK